MAPRIGSRAMSRLATETARCAQSRNFRAIIPLLERFVDLSDIISPATPGDQGAKSIKFVQRFGHVVANDVACIPSLNIWASFAPSLSRPAASGAGSSYSHSRTNSIVYSSDSFMVVGLEWRRPGNTEFDRFAEWQKHQRTERHQGLD
jgi:hypothetical protein